MKVIGLTGGIASGKSTVAKQLKEHGFVIVDADIASRKAVAKGSKGLAQVVEAFGQEALLDGEMNRPYIGSIVFQSQEERNKLNGIIHPIVREIMEAEKEAALQQGQHVIMDIPLLFENHLEETVDEVWVVYVPEEIQVDRLMKRNDLTFEEADARIKSQLPIENKKKRADVVIDNSGDLKQLSENIEYAVQQFFKRSEKN